MSVAGYKRQLQPSLPDSKKNNPKTQKKKKKTFFHNPSLEQE